LDERIVPVWVCTDFPGHGHAERYTAPGVTTTGRVSGPMSEQQKAERREVIAYNKAWDSAVLTAPFQALEGGLVWRWMRWM
jgi:ParB family chromosome partitioning protein